MDVHLHVWAVKVQGQQNGPSSLPVALAGRRGLILHCRAQQFSCSQDPWPRFPSVSVALQTASPCGIGMLHGWYSLGFEDEQNDAVYISLMSHRTHSDERGKPQLLGSWCLFRDHARLQDSWGNVIISWRKWRQEKYVLPLILLIFSSAAHSFLPQLLFSLPTKSQVAVKKAFFCGMVLVCLPHSVLWTSGFPVVSSLFNSICSSIANN